MHDRVGNRTEDQSFPRAVSMRADYDKIGVEFIRRFNDPTLRRSKQYFSRYIQWRIVKVAPQTCHRRIQDLLSIFAGGLFEFSRIGQISAVYINSHRDRHIDNADDLDLISLA